MSSATAYRPHGWRMRMRTKSTAVLPGCGVDGVDGVDGVRRWRCRDGDVTMAKATAMARSVRRMLWHDMTVRMATMTRR